MYLKSLELQGFKSFPDRTVIRFSEGMTAIVGPNGSGKSNISDAVRWVLGEQSTKSLRGEKMEDVIFGGTAKRSRMGFAQVTLILDNSAGLFPVDAAEVMVSRRFYRSGESEYTINKKRARLKDVRELFMDTGLGRDGYSIIGQGRIDEILSTKSVDRREVFEEAAGITKFRTRKSEAEKRLEQTDVNLVRIRDIWNELNERSGPLQKQAETARQYLTLREELRTYEVSLWMDTLRGMKNALDESGKKLQTAQTDLERVRAEQDERYRQIEQLEQAIMQAEMHNEQLRAERSRLEQEQAERTRRAAVLEESCKNAAENIQLAQQQIAAQAEQKRAIADQQQTRETRLRELEQDIQRVQHAQADNTEALEQTAQRIGEDQKKLEELRQAAEAYAESVFRLEKEQTAARTQLETMQQRQGSLTEEIAQAQARADSERAAQQAMQQDCAAIEEDVAAQEDILAEERERAERVTAELQEARKKHGALHSSLLDSRNRIRMLTELQKDYEGFSRAVKLVMNRAGSGQLTGVHGPVSSLIQVEDTYVTAIETALGAAASNIIVDTPEDAKRAIQLLKRSDGGRATFLPVDTIRPMRLNERGLEQLDGFCGIAAELVSCDAAYRDIVANLLGRTVVMDNLDCALPAARQYRNRFRIVTRDGQIINAGGSLTGGSTGRSSGILSRANQLSTLKRKEKQQSAELAELELRGKELAAQAQECDGIVQDASELLSANRQKLAAQQAAAQQHQALLDSVEQNLSQLLAERDDADRLRGSYEDTIRALKRRAEQAADDKQKAEQRAAQAERAGQEVSDRLRALSDEAAQLRTELVQAQTERDAHRQALHDLQALLTGAEQGAQEAQSRIADYQRQQQADRRELEQLQVQDGSHEQERSRLEQRLQDGIQQRNRLEANKTEQNKQVQAVSGQIVSLEREVARAEAAAEKLRGEEKQVLDKLWDSYELTPTAAQPVAQSVDNRPEMEKQAGALRSEIRKLGPVNLAAVEEYDTLTERLTFLTEQKDDLEQAERELRQIIAGLTEQMKDVFARSFAQLNQYFGETFQEMFGGGSAELRLEDENDVLGSGIEIRVTPPGKTVKSLMLLSGGEKAFVAIALYFAIMKVRPTPFCILDEIEAALDDVNVVRYAQYLRRLSDKTQFIVITHRRGTMEEADMLYGVTMQERGVSKLLMLNIREVEEQLGLEL